MKLMEDEMLDGLERMAKGRKGPKTAYADPKHMLELIADIRRLRKRISELEHGGDGGGHGGSQEGEGS